jgi:hypothetical protein
LLTRNRLITTTGIKVGINQTVQQSLQGQITSGQLIGTFYESFGGDSSFNQTTPYVLAFGNNPLSLNGAMSAGQIAPSSLINSITFVSPTHGSGGRAIRIPIIHLSGSQQAAQNDLRSLTRNAVGLGQKIGNNIVSSPIVSGQFFGTAYCECLPGQLTYMPDGTFVYAFGKDPLNAMGAFGGTLNTATFRDYIQLANGRVFTYSSGLIPASGYIAGNTLDDNWIFAIGKHPLNFFSDFASAPATITFTKLPTPFLSR